MSKTFAEDSKSYGCSCTAIAAWTGLVFGFVALILVSILFFNWTNGSLTAPTALERALLLQNQKGGQQQQQIAPSPPARSTSQGGRSEEFVLFGKAREFTMTDVYAPGNPTLMRLCCSAGQYHVCDGANANGNIGVQFMLIGEQGRLMVYASSEAMLGAKCTFSWW